MRLENSFTEKQNDYSTMTSNFTMILHRRYIIEIKGFSEPKDKSLPEKMFIFRLTRACEDKSNEPEAELDTIAFSSFESALAYASGIALMYNRHL